MRSAYVILPRKIVLLFIDIYEILYLFNKQCFDISFFLGTFFQFFFYSDTLCVKLPMIRICLDDFFLVIFSVIDFFIKFQNSSLYSALNIMFSSFLDDFFRSLLICLIRNNISVDLITLCQITCMINVKKWSFTNLPSFHKSSLKYV